MRLTLGCARVRSYDFQYGVVVGSKRNEVQQSADLQQLQQVVVCDCRASSACGESRSLRKCINRFF